MTPVIVAEDVPAAGVIEMLRILLSSCLNSSPGFAQLAANARRSAAGISILRIFFMIVYS